MAEVGPFFRGDRTAVSPLTGERMLLCFFFFGSNLLSDHNKTFLVGPGRSTKLASEIWHLTQENSGWEMITCIT